MKRLEDLFFFNRDMELQKIRREMQKLKETKEALSKASGIHDDIVLEKLIELNVLPEEAASISVTPLVFTAWADGNLDTEEKQAIIASLGKLKWAKTSFDHELVERWLTHKPNTSLFDAWMHYVKGLCGRMNSSEVRHFKKEIMTHVVDVAKTSGGILGLSKISSAEKRMIDKLEGAFKACEAE